LEAYASGGYVRDFLLERVSSDLDVSLGLEGCQPDTTVSGLDGVKVVSSL